jgi:hypothetical protein
MIIIERHASRLITDDRGGDFINRVKKHSMKLQTKLAGIATLTMALGVGVYAFAAHSQDRPSFGSFGMHRMGPGMMAMGPGMMGVAHDEATMSQLQGIHTMLVNHDRITRTVTNLPNGIRTVTESDDPALAGQIKAHVADMGKRVGAGDDPGLPIESEALHSIFRDKDKIHTAYETTAKGIVVVQTSDDAKTVAVLQSHAAEVTDLVHGDMAALQTAMMQNYGGMMGGGVMHGPMMMHGMMHRGVI